MTLELTVCTDCDRRVAARLAATLGGAVAAAATASDSAGGLRLTAAICVMRCGRGGALSLRAAPPASREQPDLSEAVAEFLRDRLRGPHPEV